MDNGTAGRADAVPAFRRPDISVRNTMKRELGRMPSKEEVRQRMQQEGITVATLDAQKAHTTQPVKPVKPHTITAAEAAALKGVHVSTISNWVKTGKIHGALVRGTYMVNRKDVERMQVQPRTYIQSKKKKMRAKARKQVVLKAEPARSVAATVVDHTLQNHISYAFGHCVAWLEAYANQIGMPVKALAGDVGEMLRRGK